MNRRLLIPIGIGVVLVLFWYLVLWRPASSSLSDARKRTNAATEQGARLQDQIKNLQASQAGQPLKQSQLETLRVAIPDQPNLAQFILDVNDAASTAGVDFLSITPTPPTGQSQGQGTTATTAPGGAGASAGGAALVPISVGMTVTGGYFQVLDFMNRLNKLSRIVVIDTVTMSAGGGATGAAASAAAAASTSTNLNVTLQERIFTTSPQAVSGASGGGGSGVTTTTTKGSTTTSTTSAGGG